MFQGPETDSAKPSSRVMKPPGGDSSNLFGSPEKVSPFKSHRMASNIFGTDEEPQNLPKRTNPPGGKDSGIFEDRKLNPARQLTNPPGGKSSNIFGSPQPVSTVRAHPNKPKDHIVLNDRGDSPQEVKQKEKVPDFRQPLLSVSNSLECHTAAKAVIVVVEVQRPPVEEPSVKRELQTEPTKEPEPKIDDHEPRLGPRPRSHNKVLNPPGGKSSIAFY